MSKLCRAMLDSVSLFAVYEPSTGRFLPGTHEGRALSRGFTLTELALPLDETPRLFRTRQAAHLARKQWIAGPLTVSQTETINGDLWRTEKRGAPRQNTLEIIPIGLKAL